VTTSPEGTPREEAGVLGQDNTRVLFGDSTIHADSRSGFRITLGRWLDPCQRLGIEASYFGLPNQTVRFQIESDEDGLPIIARPFFNVILNGGEEDAELDAYPGVSAGSKDISAGSRLQGVDVLLRRPMFCDCCRSLDFLAGYRTMRLDEDLIIRETTTTLSLDGPFPLGTRFDIDDVFETDNRFHGALVGVAAQWRRACWTLGLDMKVGLGGTTSRVRIDGETVVSIPEGSTTTYEAGFLAGETNIGSYRQTGFTMIPELGITLTRRLTPRLSARVGYTLLYWGGIARPSDQIDLDLNPSFLPTAEDPPTGARRPAFSFVTTDMWVQGLNLGLEYRY
jgi:hypothetical protein